MSQFDYHRSTECSWHEDGLPQGNLGRTFDTNVYFEADESQQEMDTTDYEGWNDEQELWTMVPCPRSFGYWGSSVDLHDDSLIVAVDGGCTRNGQYDATMSIGVYFGQGHAWNVSRQWDFGEEDTPPTSQKAELGSVLQALKCILAIKNKTMRYLNHVVIKSDSAYAVGAFTDWIFKWRDNGYTNTRGQPVVNAKLFQAIESRISHLQSCGVTVNFWKVPRSMNQEADELASDALYS